MKAYGFLVFFLFIAYSGVSENNQLKVALLVVGEPFYTIIIVNGFISYERALNEHNSILFDAYYKLTDAFGVPLDGTFYSIRTGGGLSYRYYFNSEKSFLNRLWLSTGFKYQNYTFDSHNKGSLSHKSDFYGANFLVGKQKYFGGEAKNWVFDLGVGLAYGERFYSYYQSASYNGSENEINTEIPEPYFLFLPEINLRIGLRF